MAPSSRDRISVDLRGLKAPLFEQARARGVSPSGLVRDALIEALGQAEPSSFDRVAAGARLPTNDRVRLSLRMSREEARAILAAARHAGLAPGAYVADLVAGVPALVGGASRDEHIAALIASSAELSTLSRDIHHLTSLLRQGNVRAAQEYRERLDTLAGDVRSHLSLASGALADLRPRSHRADASKYPNT
jgi:ribonuclease D